MSHDLVLDVRDLSVGYVRRDGSTDQVVERVSFTLERGRILGLAGESGCGKSTTALAAIGYRSPGSRIRSGESKLDGVDMLAISTTKLRKIWGSKVAYVAQSAALALNPAMTVGRQLAQPLAVHLDLHGAAARARALLMALEEHGVFVRKPNAPPLDRCIRVTVAPPDQRDAFAAIFREIWPTARLASQGGRSAGDVTP